MREATYETVYDITKEQYYDLMLSSAFQRDVHLHGLKMKIWNNVDEFSRPRALRRRAYSEPTLRLPQWMARFAQRSQAYTEYSDFDPETLSRRTRVVPRIGANVMNFVVEERYVDVEGDADKCKVISKVQIHAKILFFRNLFEKWILEQSEEKVEERDSYVKTALKEHAFDRLLTYVGEEEANDGKTTNESTQRSFVRPMFATLALAVVSQLASAKRRQRAGRRVGA